MNKRKDLLDEISNNYLFFQDKPSKAFLEIIEDYYDKVDFELDSGLSDIFFELYLSKERLTYDEIVRKCNICLSTLDRCRIRFNKLAEKLLPKFNMFRQN